MLYLPPPWKKVADMDNKKSSAVKDLLLGKVIILVQSRIFCWKFKYTIKDRPRGMVFIRSRIFCCCCKNVFSVHGLECLLHLETQNYLYFAIFNPNIGSLELLFSVN
jgi:hypothetical protein